MKKPKQKAQSNPFGRPLNDRVIIRRYDEPTDTLRHETALFSVSKPVSGSGIVLAKTAEAETEHASMVELGYATNKGEVVAVGPGTYSLKRCRDCGEEQYVRVPLTVKPGDVVFFGRFADLKRDGLCIIREADILGIVEDSEEPGRCIA